MKVRFEYSERACNAEVNEIYWTVNNGFIVVDKYNKDRHLKRYWDLKYIDCEEALTICWIDPYEGWQSAECKGALIDMELHEIRWYSACKPYGWYEKKLKDVEKITVLG